VFIALLLGFNINPDPSVLSCFWHVYSFLLLEPHVLHKVFCEPCGEVLKVVIEKIGYDYNNDIIELEIPVDHLHMVVRGEQKYLSQYMLYKSRVKAYKKVVNQY
jgi:REP element-mobilizing transposase RayT